MKVGYQEQKEGAPWALDVLMVGGWGSRCLVSPRAAQQGRCGWRGVM